MRDRFAEILQMLRYLGPMTSSELSRELQLHRNAVADALCKMQKKRKTRARLIYIERYVMDDEGDGVPRMRAVFALGDKANARRPSTSAAMRSARYRDRKKIRVSSVFALAIPAVDRIKGKVWTPGRNEHERSS